MKELTDIEIAWEYHNRLIEVYQKKKLESLEGLDGDYEVKGENILQSFMDAKSKMQVIYDEAALKKGKKPDFEFRRAFHDLCLISREILHFTGLTYFYLPYLENPENNRILSGKGNFIYPLYQDMPDKRFFMYMTVCYEKLYNYWDRIGDIIAAYFPESIESKRVYFGGIDEFVPARHHSNEHFQWLVSFKNDNYSHMNEIRKNIVHNDNPDTDYYFNYLKEVKDLKRVKRLVQKRSEVPSKIKTQITYTLEGIIRLIRFMEYLNNTDLNDDEIKKEKQKACA